MEKLLPTGRDRLETTAAVTRDEVKGQIYYILKTYFKSPLSQNLYPQDLLQISINLININLKNHTGLAGN